MKHQSISCGDKEQARANTQNTELRENVQQQQQQHTSILFLIVGMVFERSGPGNGDPRRCHPGPSSDDFLERHTTSSYYCISIMG